MDRKIFTLCNIEKKINNFYKKSTHCRDYISKRSLKRYYESKDEISK